MPTGDEVSMCICSRRLRTTLPQSLTLNQQMTNAVCKYYRKKDHESLSRLFFSEFKLATNKTLEYDMPRASLKVICTARFWIDSSW